VDRARCVFGKYNTRYSCIVYADEGYLEAYSFSSTTISAETTIHFTIDSIRNPSVEGPTGSWTVQTLDTQGSQVDVGENWYFDDDYWGPGNITTFEVEALSEGVGAYPVKYRFHMVPVGEICQDCYFQIDIPPEIEIVDREALTNKCGTDLQDFVEDEIRCYTDANMEYLYIDNGFLTSRTTNLTDDDYYDDPPDIYFTIDYFRNPRTPLPTTPWNITILNSTDDI
jgi:hypothetical protein